MAKDTIPLLETKLHAPRRHHGVVARPRLAQRLHASDLPALTLISAPAGFGKTTAALELFGDEQRRGWVSLDRRDNEPAVFWSYVVAALDSIEPGVGDSARSLFRSPLQSSDPALATLINDIDALDHDLVLVLDDYHLIEAPEIHSDVTFLLEHRPPQLHLVVVTRSDPPLPLAALRARGELLEIRVSDLRFTVEESAAYLNDAMGLALTTGDVERLGARTEGWAAALQLAALSLQGHADAASFVDGFSGDDRFILDYLVDEVLDRQTPEVRAFLLETSILERLTGPLCDAVTLRSDGKALLETLDRANLFLVPLDDRREWYRYHHLFADVLRARLLDERPDVVADLHRRALAWFDANGDVVEAITHALESDAEAAARLIELAAPTVRGARQDATLRGWLEALPGDVLADRPVLAVALAGARMATGDAAGVAQLATMVEHRLQADEPPVVFDHEAFARIPAQLAMHRAALALLGGELDESMRHARRVLDLAGPSDHLERGAGSALLGLSAWANGDLEESELRYAAAIDCFIAGDFLPDVLGCSVALGDMQIAKGRLADAMNTFERGRLIVEEHPGLRGAADMHVGLAEVLLERNRVADAEKHLRVARDLGEAAGLPQNPYRLRVADARLQRALGDLQRSLELLEEAERLYNTDFSPSVRPVTAMKVRLQVEMGDLEAGRSWAAVAGLSADDEPNYLREFEQLTFASVLIALGGAGDAEAVNDAIRLLTRVHAAAELGGRQANAVEALALLGRAHGQPEQQIPTFTKADLAPSTTLVDPLSQRELGVLRLLKSELSGPEIARELHVSLNTFRTHTKNIYMKLGVNNRREVVRRAAELGL